MKTQNKPRCALTHNEDVPLNLYGVRKQEPLIMVIMDIVSYDVPISGYLYNI